MYYYLEFKLCYLTNLKLFSNRVKELFEPTVLRKKKKKKKKLTGFALFKSIFLRNRSLSNTRWFCSKNCKIGKGNQYLTENRLNKHEMWCAADNHNHMCHICAKELLDSNFKGTDHDFCWSGKPIYHLQKQGNTHIFQNKYQNPHKFTEIMKKNRVFGKMHSWGHSNRVFNFLKF